MRPLFAKFATLLLCSALLSACTIPFVPQKSGVQITSSPQASVFLNDQSYGSTPIIRDDLKPGSYKIKIVPNDSSLLPWESNITLTSNIITVVDRQLSSDPTLANGYILSFEKLSDAKATDVSIITSQSNVSVAIDGKPAGFTPYSTNSLDPNSHVFFLSSPGFQDKTIKALIKPGLRLVINAQLATQSVIPTPTPTISLTPSPTATPSSTTTNTLTPQPKQSTSSASIATPYVEILTTPTGWLKVRATGDANGTELAKVNPGDRFPYLDTNTTGWFQIEYATGKNGWVSGTYAKLVK